MSTNLSPITISLRFKTHTQSVDQSGSVAVGRLVVQLVTSIIQAVRNPLSELYTQVQQIQ